MQRRNTDDQSRSMSFGGSWGSSASSSSSAAAHWPCCCTNDGPGIPMLSGSILCGRRMYRNFPWSCTRSVDLVHVHGRRRKAQLEQVLSCGSPRLSPSSGLHVSLNWRQWSVTIARQLSTHVAWWFTNNDVACGVVRLINCKLVFDEGTKSWHGNYTFWHLIGNIDRTGKMIIIKHLDRDFRSAFDPRSDFGVSRIIGLHQSIVHCNGTDICAVDMIIAWPSLSNVLNRPPKLLEKVVFVQPSREPLS